MVEGGDAIIQLAKNHLFSSSVGTDDCQSALVLSKCKNKQQASSESQHFLRYMLEFMTVQFPTKHSHI